MNKIELVSVGGLVFGFGIVMLLAAFALVKPCFDPTLLGLGVTLLSLGLMF